MDVQTVLSEFLNYPEISASINLLRTDRWAQLSDSDKKKFFIDFNAALCKYLNMEEIILSFGNTGINSEDFNDDSYYRNVIVTDEGNFIINDIKDNQYMILYEYLYRLRGEFQFSVCYSDFGDNFDSSIKEKWKKNMHSEAFGSFSVDFYIDEDEYLSEFQDVRIDASQYAEKILFEILRRNYSENSYDEQTFLCDRKILANKMLMKAGIALTKKKIETFEYDKNILIAMKKTLEALEEVDLKLIHDDNLFIAIYPEISKCINVVLLMEIYKEISYRLTNNYFDIHFYKNNVVINGNAYYEKFFKKNHFNIFLYELLKEVDIALREDKKFLRSVRQKGLNLEEEIVLYKEKSLINTLEDIDSRINPDVFGPIGYQPLSKLINNAELLNNLTVTANGRVPIRLRRK